MSEPYIHTRSPDLPPAAESGPIFIFHGEVHGFTYSANPQGDLVSCMMVNDPANLTSPSGSTSWSKSLRQDRRHNTSRAQSSGTASQTRNFRPSESSDPSVYVPPPLSSSFEGNQDAESNTNTTPTVYYDFESTGGVEGASITSNRGLPTGDPTDLIDESKEFLRSLFDMYRRGFFQLGRQNAPGLFLQ